MTQPNTSATFKQTALANTTGVDNGVQQGTIAFMTADPTAPQLLVLSPIVWLNTTTGLMKFCVNGTTVEVVTSV